MTEDNITDIKNKLDKALDWIESKKESSKKTGSSSFGWIFALISSVIVFIILAIAAYSAWKKGKEVAKLKHRIDVAEEEKKQLEVERVISSEKKEVALLEKRISDKQNNIGKIKQSIETIETSRKNINDRIDKITKWEDVDEFLKK